tara:strand:- start:605 stop:1075 length:471 start_codon:yes stop_codon:yes gene_type:complete
MSKKKIVLGGDHAGFELKEKLLKWLVEKGYEIEDFGPHGYDKLDDYPDYVIPMAERVAKSKGKSVGIMIAGSGIGEVIAAGKVKGIRAVLYHGGKMEVVKISKKHDHTNVLSLGSRLVKETEAKKAIELWLRTPESNQARHKRRLGKITRYENRRK